MKTKQTITRNDVGDIEELGILAPKKGLHIGANPQRVKVEEIAQEVKGNKVPAEVTLAMVHAQNKKILEQNAYIIELLSKRK